MTERILTLCLNEGDSVTLRTAKQRQAYREIKRKKASRLHEGRFTFADLDNVANVTGQIKPVYLGYLLYIQTYIDYETGVIVSGRYKRPMSRSDLRAVLKVSRETFRTLYENLERYSIIWEDAKGHIYVNKAYHFRGTAAGRDRLVKCYDIRIRKLSSSVRALKQLGYLYRALPYVHFRDNLLCWNPSELDPEKIQAINKEELAQVIGIDVKTLYRLTKTLTVDDLHVFAEIRRGRDSLFLVNPWIFNRGEYPLVLDSIFHCKTRR